MHASVIRPSFDASGPTGVPQEDLSRKNTRSRVSPSRVPAARHVQMMQDLEVHYQKAHRAHFGYQRGLGN